MNARRMIGGVSSAILIALTATACGGPDDNPNGAVDADCKPAHNDLKTVKEGELLVSTYVSPPYSELASAGAELGGIDGKIVREIAKLECLKVSASPVTGAAFTEGVATGRSDIVIGGVYATPERDEQFTLSDALYRDGMAFLSENGVSSIDAVEGKKVGVIQGYLWTDDLQEVLGKDNVSIYQDADSMVADLSVGRIGVATLTTAEAGYRAKQVDGLKVATVESDSRVTASEGDSNVIILMNEDAGTLAEAVNADIAKLLGDGTIAKILDEGGISSDLAGSAG